MKLEVGKVYRLEGWIFNQEILEKNKDGFEFVGTTKESMHDDEYCKFVGKNTGLPQSFSPKTPQTGTYFYTCTLQRNRI